MRRGGTRSVARLSRQAARPSPGRSDASQTACSAAGMAQQNRSWEFDLEEGLSRLRPPAAHHHRSDAAALLQTAKDTNFRHGRHAPDHNSGSYARPPDHRRRDLRRYSCAARWSAARESRNPGFHNQGVEGRTSREKWLAGGKPQSPGRSTILRHIIYKSADAPWVARAASRPDDARGTAQGEHTTARADVGA